MENEGIMSLPDQGMPETDENLYLAAKQAAMDQAPEQTAQFSSAIQEGLGAEGMTAADAQQLLQLVDYIIANAANYPQIRQQLIAQGLADPEDLPEQFNPQFFAALKAGLLEFITSGAGPTMPMAQGGLASLGRFGDTQLAHISPEEAAVLRSMGGRGSINPRTGLPEYFSWKSFLKTAVRVVGTIALTAVGVPPPIASAITTKVTGGSWKEALIAGVTAGVGQAVSPFISDFIGGSLPAALQPYASDVAQGIFATGVGLARGQNLGQALRGGLQAGVVSAGMRAIGTPSERETRNEAFRQQLQQAGQPGQAPTVGSQAMAPAQAPVSNVVTPSDVTAASPGGASIPQQISMLEANMAPQGPGQMYSGYDFSPGGQYPQGYAYPKSLGPDVQELAATGRIKPSVDVNLVQDVMRPQLQALSAPQIPIVQAASEIPGQSATANQPLTGIERLAGMVPGGPQALDYLKGQTPGGIQEAGAARAEQAAGQAFQKAMSNPLYANLQPSTREFYALQAAEAARKAAMPGVLATYGPSVAAGLGLLGATGGFKTKPINIPESAKITGATLLAQNPAKYGLLPPPGMASGGIMSMMAGGGYPRRTGQIAGPGTEKSDDIPAMLSDGEFVLTARAVRGAGNGSRREGAKRLYRLMHTLEKNAPARA